MGTLFVDKLDPQSGTSLEIGSSGDTVSVNTGATTNLAGNVTLGASGKTITIPSGATITNNGTQTGFGGANTPSFQAQNSSRTTVATNTYTKIAYTTENWDLGGDYDASNSRFTPQTAGKYYVYHSGGFNTGDDFEPLRVAIYKNGSLLIENQYRQAYYDIHYVGGAVDMNGSTDYLEAYASQNSGSNKDFDNNNNVRVKFGAFRIIT